MYEIPSNFEAQFFGPGTHIEATPERIGQCIAALGGRGFLPTTVREFRLASPQQVRMQLRLVTAEDDWSISFEAKRLLIKWTPTDPASTAEQFIQEVGEILLALDALSLGNGSRLSFVSSGIAKKASVPGVIATGNRLVNLPQYYLSNPPSEWATRFIAHSEMTVNSSTELANIITDINGITAIHRHDLSQEAFKAIEVGFDINTVPERQELRFKLADLAEFTVAAHAISLDIFPQLREYWNVNN